MLRFQSDQEGWGCNAGPWLSVVEMDFKIQPQMGMMRGETQGGVTSPGLTWPLGSTYPSPKRGVILGILLGVSSNKPGHFQVGA